MTVDVNGETTHPVYAFLKTKAGVNTVSWNFAKDLPPEASSEDGFQNSSELLQMSVMQFETYRRLARKAFHQLYNLFSNLQFWSYFVK